MYRQTKTVDDTGQTQREWSLLSVIACHASRDINSKDLWKESSTESTIFDVVGIDPITDGFGQFIEYEVFLSRSEVQNLG